VALSVLGMLIISLTPAHTDGGSIATKLAGVVLASLSSGAGELSFLGLTHFYGRFSLAAWGSGTGAAGLVGAGAYALATTSFGLSVKATLLASACLPVIMLVSFFAVLPLGPLRQMSRVAYETVDERSDGEAEADQHDTSERDGLLDAPGTRPYAKAIVPASDKQALFRENLNRSKRLFLPLYVCHLEGVCIHI
jgi:battenin